MSVTKAVQILREQADWFRRQAEWYRSTRICWGWGEIARHDDEVAAKLDAAIAQLEENNDDTGSTDEGDRTEAAAESR